MKNFQTLKVVQFVTGDPPLVMFEQCRATYSSNDCENPDTALLQSSNLWHQILIHHDGQYSKEEILEGFFEVVDGELFIPIAYKRGNKIDYFFISKEFGALKKIFDKKLLIPMKERSLQVVIKAGVAECQSNHRFYPKINSVISQFIKQSTSLGASKALNLDEFSLHHELREMSINFGNVGTLDLFLNFLNGFQKLKGHTPYRIFKFAKNNIKSLQPFRVLYDFQMETLDLSYNKISDIDEMENLKFLNVQELYIKGNPCAEKPENLEKLREILPGLRKLDNITIATTPTIYKSNIKGEAIKIGNKPIPSEAIKDGISISQKNRTIMIKSIFGLRDDNMWSKVLVHHDEKFKREQILKVIAKDVCFNALFFPCYSKRFKNRDEFFLYKNFDAVKVMMQRGLKVPMNNQISYNIHINFNVAEFKEDHVDWSENLKYVIAHRIKNNKLNLNDFLKEELLSNIFICIDNFNTLNFVLDQARLVSNQVTEIHMENCQISNCEGFLLISSFEKLKILNLRNNNIEKLEGFRKATTVIEVFLDGNPICNQDPLEYIINVSNYFPSLEWLDGCRVQKGNSMVTFQNYLTTIDVYTVVDEFIKHYFTLWDSFERPLLKNMYRPNSILTMCMSYEYKKEKDTLGYQEIYPRVQKFIHYDHNLKNISDVSKAFNKVYIGIDNINRFMNDLPKTKHDLVNCNIDVPYFDRQKSQIVIIISGFMEELTNDKPFLLAFTRTFTIKGSNSEFHITNDQMLFRNPTDIQREAHTKSVASAKYKDLVENCLDLLPTEMESKTLKLVMLEELTHCKREFCLK